MRQVKALSVRGPWAWAILYAGKNIENRSRRTKYRGPLVIHSSRTRDLVAEDWLRSRRLYFPEDFPTGALVGIVDLVDCLDRVPRNRWASGPFCYVLRNPRIIAPPVDWRGQLGFFNVPDTFGRDDFAR